MALGCTNPAAVNYDPEATGDDGSCVYLVPMNGQCLEFEDVDIEDAVVDRSFTLSFDVVDKVWSFFHDYFPDYYFHTRKKLFTIKSNNIHEHNAGLRGLYYDRTATKPFFMDVLFTGKESRTLNSINWISEIRDSGNREADDNSAALFQETITHITIWNNYQCTGRIALTPENLELGSLKNKRNSEQNWNFNDFRNIALDDEQFLDTLFNNFAILSGSVDTDLPWYKRQLIEGKYFIVRFEFTNANDKQITLHDVDVDTDISYRS